MCIDRDHCGCKVRLVSTNIFIHCQDTNIHLRYIYRAVAREIWSQVENVAHGDKEVAAVVDLVRSEAASDVYLYEYSFINSRYPKHNARHVFKARPPASNHGLF